MSKVTVSTIWMDGCSGCHMSLLDIDERIIDLAEHIDIVYSPLVDNKHYPEQVDVAIIEGAVAYDEDFKKLKKILFQELYHHKNIVRKMYAGKKAVQGLFDALMDEPKMLPKYYAMQLEKRSQHRVIADYIASMSDRFAMTLYNEVFGLR